MNARLTAVLFPRMRQATRTLSILLPLLALTAAPSLAAHVVHFKNGFELVVEKIRYDGQTAFVTFNDGSEAGFPVWVIDSVDIGKAVSSGPPAKRKQGTDSPSSPLGVHSWTGAPKSAKDFLILNSQSAIKVPHGKSIPVGFSFGNEDNLFRSAPSGPVTPDGKVGINIKDRMGRDGSSAAGAQTTPGAAQSGPPKIRPIKIETDQ